MIKVLSLFTGCGGLDYGFHKEKYKIIFANDNFLDACKTYEKNFNNEINSENILDININKFPKTDIIIGGPPCQGFSGIGNRNPKDERSQLVWKFLEIVNFLKPKIFLMENVAGIRNSKTPYGKLIIKELEFSFQKMGYNVNTYLLNSADYGVPQKRKRVFILGNLIKKNISPPSPTHSEDGMLYKLWINSKSSLSDLPIPNVSGIVNYISPPKTEYQNFLRNKKLKGTNLHFKPYASDHDKIIIKYVKPGGNYYDIPDEYSSKRIMNFKKTGGRTTTYGRLHPDKPSFTLNTWFDRPNVGCNIHYSQKRLITVREGLRIQSFPDDFNLISRNKRNFYTQVGNAVPPLLSLAWARHLKIFM